MLALARRRGGRTGCARWLAVPLALASGALGGCSVGWDEITSRDYHFKDMFKKPPDPMWVIQNSPDGDKKARAFRSLKEPLRNGGTQQEQDTIVRLLVWTAGNDPQAICRLAAVDALRHFHDPRAVAGLTDAYYQATGLAASGRPAGKDFSPQGFPQETVSIIRTVVLTALGDSAAVQDAQGQATAVQTLVSALLAAPAENNAVALQQSQDERTAAARALGHFPQYQSTEALVKVLRTTPDIALRNRAREALVKITGKDLPPDAQTWDDFLHKSPPSEAVAGSGNVFDNFLRHFSGPTEKAEAK